MNAEDYLYACVEAGIALSGFAALALAIRSRTGANYTPYERGLVASLVERGLVAALLGLTPLLLQSFQLAEQAVWGASSGLFLLYGASIVARSVAARRQPDSESFVGRRVFIPIFAVGIVVMSTQLFNILPLGIEQGAHWFLLANTWLLLSAGYLFWFFLRAWVRAA